MLSILRKSMSVTSRNDYTEVIMTLSIYMLEKMYKTSIEQLSQVTIIQIWEGEPGTRMPRICKRFFHAKCLHNGSIPHHMLIFSLSMKALIVYNDKRLWPAPWVRSPIPFHPTPLGSLDHGKIDVCGARMRRHTRTSNWTSARVMASYWRSLRSQVSLPISYLQAISHWSPFLFCFLFTLLPCCSAPFLLPLFPPSLELTKSRWLPRVCPRRFCSISEESAWVHRCSNSITTLNNI